MLLVPKSLLLLFEAFLLALFHVLVHLAVILLKPSNKVSLAETTKNKPKKRLYKVL
jgi:hypothetical protein